MSQTEFSDMDFQIETSQSVGTLFIKDVAKIDCALFDPTLGIIGQTWFVDVFLTGPLDNNGFVYDFSPLKAMIKQILASSFDHTTIVPVGSQSVQYSEAEGLEHWKLRSKSRAGDEVLWSYVCPKNAVFPIRCVALKTNIIEQEFSRILRHRLDAQLHNLSVKLREEATTATEASYRYTHGISGHNGLCQRLFHGHRSRIEIYVGEERRPDLEHYIVRDIFGSNVHIATRQQVKAGIEHLPELGRRGNTDGQVTLAFRGNLGYYEGILPANRIFLVEQETSVECISREIARVIKREENTAEKIRIICYEGIDKGAIALI